MYTYFIATIINTFYWGFCLLNIKNQTQSMFVWQFAWIIGLCFKWNLEAIESIPKMCRVTTIDPSFLRGILSYFYSHLSFLWRHTANFFEHFVGLLEFVIPVLHVINTLHMYILCNYETAILVKLCTFHFVARIGILKKKQAVTNKLIFPAERCFNCFKFYIKRIYSQFKIIQKQNCIPMDKHSFEWGDNGVFITLVPKVLHELFLFVCLTILGSFIEFDWLVP